MYYLNIDKSSSIPIYKQLENGILAALDARILRTHDVLPKEDDLCDFFSISRTVVRQAYQSLEDQGILYRVKGKGTFISAISHLSFSTNDILRLEKALLEKKKDISKFVVLNDSATVLSASTLAVHFPIHSIVNVHAVVYSNPFGPLLYVEDVFHSKVAQEVSNALSQNHSPFELLSPQFKGASLSVSLEDAAGPITSLLKLDLPDAIHRVKIAFVDENQDVIVLRQYILSGKNTSFETLIEGDEA